MDDQQRALIEERAKECRQWPLVHCLMTYGWRPSSAARILVGDVNLSARTMLLREAKSADALERQAITDALMGTGLITIRSRRVRLCYARFGT